MKNTSLASTANMVPSFSVFSARNISLPALRAYGTFNVTSLLTGTGNYGSVFSRGLVRTMFAGDQVENYPDIEQSNDPEILDSLSAEPVAALDFRCFPTVGAISRWTPGPLGAMAQPFDEENCVYNFLVERVASAEAWLTPVVADLR
jgi:hypothetical protein